ncbi:SET and MYND domain-containing protein 3 [Globomyces sp. JEL0801]|nr:SET and MYND domain-containing protein 3 [Globomyces sp. JEL0801]
MAQKAYSESFGQHFIASKDLIPGELLITENPLAKVLDEKNYNSHCGNCSKELTKKILKCSACSSIVYCCISCQRSDWKIHKLECQGFRKAKPNRPNTMLRLLSRFLYAINLNPQVCDLITDSQMADGLGSNDPKERFKRNGDLGSLVSHKENFSSSKLESYAEMIMGLPLIVRIYVLTLLGGRASFIVCI